MRCERMACRSLCMQAYSNKCISNNYAHTEPGASIRACSAQPRTRKHFERTTKWTNIYTTHRFCVCVRVCVCVLSCDCRRHVRLRCHCCVQITGTHERSHAHIFQPLNCQNVVMSFRQQVCVRVCVCVLLSIASGPGPYSGKPVSSATRLSDVLCGSACAPPTDRLSAPTRTGVHRRCRRRRGWCTILYTRA